MRLRILFVVSVFCFLSLSDITYAQWEPDVRLTYDDSSSRTSDNNTWCVASDGDNVHVVWYDRRDGGYYENNEIYYKRSTDRGTNWE